MRQSHGSSRVKNLSVSIVIPTHNRAHLIGRAIRSALAAVVPGDEIIVVDDGSSDGSGEVARRFGSRIRYERQERRGVSAARNHGVSLATGDLICFLDADDLFSRRKLEIQTARFAERADLELCVALTKNFWSSELRADERDDDALRAHGQPARQAPIALHHSADEAAQTALSLIEGCRTSSRTTTCMPRQTRSI